MTEPDSRALPDDEKRMSFMEHLVELRQRLRNGAIAFVMGLIVTGANARKLFDLLTRPVREAWASNDSLGPLPVFRFASLSEPLWVYTKLALMGALLLSSPFILWEIWRFIKPGLYRRERRGARIVVAATCTCFSLGAVFGYNVIGPSAVAYLLSFARTEEALGGAAYQIEPAIMMNEVLGFQLMLLAGCGVAFELPVILALLGWLGLVTARGLWRFNRFALVLSALLGGILTPGPDVLSQVLMAIPLFCLYNISILLVFLIEKRRAGRGEA